MNFKKLSPNINLDKNSLINDDNNDDDEEKETIVEKQSFHNYEVKYSDKIFSTIVEKSCDSNDKELFKDEINNDDKELIQNELDNNAQAVVNYQSSLLRLFESKVFNMKIALCYFIKSKEPGLFYSMVINDNPFY